MKILTHFYKDIFQFFKKFFQYNCYKNVFHCRISGSHRVIWKVERSLETKSRPIWESAKWFPLSLGSSYWFKSIKK